MIAAASRAGRSLARSILSTTLALSIFAFGTTEASAHAHLLHAAPGANDTVHQLPDKLELSFSEAVELAFSTIEVFDPAGGRVDAGKPESDPGDAKVLRVPLERSSQGTYKITWRVLSVDMHRSSGSYSFTVAP